MLFPDRREPVGVGSAWLILRRTLQLHGGGLMGNQPMGIAVTEMDASDLLDFACSLDWRYPVPVMFRTHGEDRWSHATVIGRSKGEEE